jgi:hypothetical protein
MVSGITPVIIDNKIWANESKAYVVKALELGLSVIRCIVDVGTGGVSAEYYTRENTHGFHLKNRIYDSSI